MRTWRSAIGSCAVAVCVTTLTACSSDSASDDASLRAGRDGATTTTTIAQAVSGTPPTGPRADLLRTAIAELRLGGVTATTADAFARSEDPSLGWVIADLIRMGSDFEGHLLTAFHTLFDNDADAAQADDWIAISNLLTDRDVPAPEGYRVFKGELFVAADSRWAPIVQDPDSALDPRWLTWGGVTPDRRQLGTIGPCVDGCIPANDDPPLTDAGSGDWYPDERLVFGVTVGGETVAFPKHIMEVHEMVNITIGGRRLAIPYCTLCGSAQAFLSDDVTGSAQPLVMRTSGLVYLSNKVMYDLDSGSAFETFSGRAVTGPLARAGVELTLVTTVTSTWGKWKTAHPDTKIVAKDGGWGRSYPLDPLGDRDADGPIFPARLSDTRLGPHVQVLGVHTTDGTAVAFAVDEASTALAAGERVETSGVTLALDGTGLRAMFDGKEVPSHQAFWFAWAQFNRDTELWRSSSPRPTT